MSAVKSVVTRQYRHIVQQALSQAVGLTVPPEGWLCTVRKALGMSGAQLARRLGVTRALINQTQKAELAGGVTLKTMQHMAEAMGCRFVYAIVPKEGGVDDLIRVQARKKAARLVAKTNTQMALEEQSLSSDQINYEIDRLVREMAEAMPSDFWDE